KDIEGKVLGGDGENIYGGNKRTLRRRVEIVKQWQSKHFREVGKKVMDESMRLDNDNTCTLHQIVEDMLKETINDISQIDLNGV
ncbi:6104_t:CDS:2, partial [Funneliformis mosseae]